MAEAGMGFSGHATPVSANRVSARRPLGPVMEDVEERGGRRRVVLRSSGKRRQLVVSGGAAPTGEARLLGNHLEQQRHRGSAASHSHYDYHEWDQLHNLDPSRSRAPVHGSRFHAGGLSISGRGSSNRLLHSTPVKGGGALLHHAHLIGRRPRSVPPVLRGVTFSATPTGTGTSSDYESDEVFERGASLGGVSPSPLHQLSPLHPTPPPFPPTRPLRSHPQSKATPTSPFPPSRFPHSPHPPPSTSTSTSSDDIDYQAHTTLTGGTLTSTLLNCSLPPLLTSNLRKKPSLAPSLGGCLTSSLSSKGEFGIGNESAADVLNRHFPDQHIRVYVATWNMHEEKELPQSLDDLLLPVSQELVADVFVIGSQESTPLKREWEVLVQQTLGPSHVLVHSASLGALCLLFFLRRDLIWYCSAVRSSGYVTKPLTGLLRTKGGVGAGFSLFGSSFLFVSSHLAAHAHRVEERNSDFHRIATNLPLHNNTSATGLVTDGYDYVFWMGDLNYRVELERSEVNQYLDRSDWMSLLLRDQLTREILQGKVFQGYSEQPITFPPTYKFDLHTDNYDSSEKQRTPSWTDRILFKSRDHSTIIGCGYDTCSVLKCSDHKPVYSMFRVKLTPVEGVDGIPDSVVSFDREVYLKAHERRKHVARLLSQQEHQPQTQAKKGGRGRGEGLDEPDTGQLQASSALPTSLQGHHVTSSLCNIL